MLHIEGADILPDDLGHAHLQGSREVLTSHLGEPFRGVQQADKAAGKAFDIVRREELHRDKFVLSQFSEVFDIGGEYG